MLDIFLFILWWFPTLDPKLYSAYPGCLLGMARMFTDSLPPKFIWNCLIKRIPQVVALSSEENYVVLFKCFLVFYDNICVYVIMLLVFVGIMT